MKKLIRHYVFGAANCEENMKSIELAKKALSIIEEIWEMNANACGYYEGSKSGVLDNDGGNTEIYFEDNDISRLINSCMSFTREYTRLKCKNDVL